MSFALDTDSPPELRVDMFVKRNAPPQGDDAGKTAAAPRYDIGWAEEFTGDDSCNFKSLDIIAHETGVDFSAMGVRSNLKTTHALTNISQSDVVLWHTISRFWAIKNGLINTMKTMRTAQQDTTQKSQTEAELQAKIDKLEKMTFKVLKQNATINKRLKHRQKQIAMENNSDKSTSLWKKLFG